MFSTIITAIGSIFGGLNKIFTYFQSKNEENKIKKGYEEAKRADALEEDQKASKLIDASEKELSKVNIDLELISKASTDVNIVQENESQRQVNDELSKKVKESIDKIESDDRFNSGEEIILKG